MSQERAFEIINGEISAAFDPLCVQALRVAVGAPAIEPAGEATPARNPLERRT